MSASVEHSSAVAPASPPGRSGPSGPPVRHPVMLQRWDDVTFLHWRYDAPTVQRLLPDGVQVDTLDGHAWVSLVPFRMEDLRLPVGGRLPAGSFPEVNVRTYVRAGARRGVWFFSLDIDRLAPTAVARSLYRLPYCWGRVDHVRVGDVVSTRVQRRWPRRGAAPAEAALRVRTGTSIDPSEPTTAFLTARWGLVAPTRRRLLWAAVDHEPWPLHRAEVEHLDESLLVAAGLPEPEGPPLAMWASRVHVRVGRPVRC